MPSFSRFNKFNGKILVRIFAFILSHLIIPLAIRMIKKKITEHQRFWCSVCNRKLEKINKYEYYCKNCKIIRKD